MPFVPPVPASGRLAIEAEVAIIGAGPAGLMAAEVLSQAGVAVDVFDAMPSAGRKFLLAGRGGLNLTHAEPLDRFVARFGEQAEVVGDWLADFGPAELRAWAAGLGVATFVGSSGRVFPVAMKAAPLLRAWLHRLRQPQAPGATPVRFHMRHRWIGWQLHDAANSVASDQDEARDIGQFVLQTPSGQMALCPRAAVLALGGASWPRLGSDGAWQPWLAQAGAAVAPLLPANCGFDVAGTRAPGWTPLFAERCAGQPLKNVVLTCTDGLGRRFEQRGEFVFTATGVEGSLIYAASGLLRDEIARAGRAGFQLDLLPDRSAAQLQAALERPRGSRSLSAHLRARLGLGPAQSALLHELLPPETLKHPATLAQALKALPIVLRAPRPVQEAISSAGGVRWQALTPDLALRSAPGLFCAGEMLDWEAPTGGYLLTASLASGMRAARGVLRHLAGLEAAGSRPAFRPPGMTDRTI